MHVRMCEHEPDDKRVRYVNVCTYNEFVISTRLSS